MLELLRKRREDEDRGFTLIELMVVVLIIAILIAIAIPTFLGARKRAQDRAAQSNLRNALTAEKTFYTDNQEYTADATSLKDIEPSLTYGAGVSAPANAGDVNVAISPNESVVCLTSHSASGDDFVLVDVATGTGAGTFYKKGTLTSCADNLTLGQQSLVAKW